MNTITLDYAGENRIFTALHLLVQDLCKENTPSALKSADENYRFMMDLQCQTGRISPTARENMLKAWVKDYKRLLKTVKPDTNEFEIN